MELALEATLGHSSAHSFATGPVIADPETHNHHLHVTWCTNVLMNFNILNCVFNQINI